jgi:hypothetical protein
MRWALRVAATASALALVLVVVTLIVVARDNRWAPLGPYPEQHVVSTQTVQWSGPETFTAATTEQIPAVNVAGPLVVEGTKCASGETIVRGTKVWTSLDPRGFSHDEGSSISTRTNGCRTAVVRNPIPPEVQAWAREQHATETLPVLRVGGCEVPVAQGQGDGVELCWATEPFALVVNDQ